MTTETRILPTATQQIRAVEGPDGQKRLRGYGVVFNSRSEDLGGFREEVDPNAANRTIAHGNDVLVTQNHDVNMLLGRTSSRTARVGIDDVGVWYEVDLPDTQAGRDAWTLADRGDLAGSSFTFSLPKNGAEWRDDNGQRVRRLTEFRLHELGPVASPAYLDTTVAARSLSEWTAEHDNEEEVRSPETSGTETPTADDTDEGTRVRPTVNIAARRLRFAR